MVVFDLIVCWIIIVVFVNGFLFFLFVIRLLILLGLGMRLKFMFVMILLGCRVILLIWLLKFGVVIIVVKEFGGRFLIE